MTAKRPEWEAVEINVRRGVEWLTSHRQPSSAHTHSGDGVHVGGHLYVSFMPWGQFTHAPKSKPGKVTFGGLRQDRPRQPTDPRVATINFSLSNPNTDEYGGGQPEPFTQAECDYLKGLIVDAGGKVVDDWNGDGFDSYSVKISGVTMSMARAADRYMDGCPEHDSVFCSSDGCDWYDKGHARLTDPRFVAVARPGLGGEADAGDDDDRNLRAVLEALERIRPVLADVGYHPDTIVAGRRGDIIEDDRAFTFEAKSGHGVCLPAEAAVRLIELLEQAELI